MLSSLYLPGGRVGGAPCVPPGCGDRLTTIHVDLYDRRAKMQMRWRAARAGWFCPEAARVAKRDDEGKSADQEIGEMLVPMASCWRQVYTASDI
jgi:hypothetical protein